MINYLNFMEVLEKCPNITIFIIHTIIGLRNIHRYPNSFFSNKVPEKKWAHFLKMDIFKMSKNGKRRFQIFVKSGL